MTRESCCSSGVWESAKVSGIRGKKHSRECVLNRWARKMAESKVMLT